MFMANAEKRRRVSYRKCILETPDGSKGSAVDLQGLLENALKIVPLPWKKLISGQEYHLLAHKAVKGKCLTGAIVNYESEQEVPLVDVLPDGKTWEDTAPPVDRTGTVRKFKKSTLVFAVRENHVAVAGTKELRVDDLLLFLRWLIQERAMLVNGWAIDLLNLPSKGASTKINQMGVNKVSVGGNAFFLARTPLSEPSTKTRRKRIKKEIKQNSHLVHILKSVIKDQAILDEIPLQEETGNLHVSIEISYHSKKGPNSQKLVDSIAAGFGDIEGCDPKIILKDGSKIQGDELTIAEYLNVQAPGGNISIDDAMTKTATWLQSAVTSGKVF